MTESEEKHLLRMYVNAVLAGKPLRITGPDGAEVDFVGGPTLFGLGLVTEAQRRSKDSGRDLHDEAWEILQENLAKREVQQ